MSLHHEIPLAGGQCAPECEVLETLSDDRPCEEDPACPASWCPPATVEDAESLSPCVDPATGAECRPFKRDLGLQTDADGTKHRLCLMRQASRTWDATTASCTPAEEAGWYCAPDGDEVRCAFIGFQTDPAAPWRPALESGSQVSVRCGYGACRE